MERVIVTGSLIPTAEEVGPNPVFAINRDLINKSGGGSTTEQLLQRQPVMNGATIPVQNNATSQGGPAGTAALALRGLDPGAFDLGSRQLSIWNYSLITVSSGGSSPISSSISRCHSRDSQGRRNP